METSHLFWIASLAPTSTLAEVVIHTPASTPRLNPTQTQASNHSKQELLQGEASPPGPAEGHHWVEKLGQA